jgi:hypothetical protein
MGRIYLAEITAYDPALPGVVTLRYASGLGYNHPSAPAYYEPRIIEPGQIRRSMFAGGTTLGAVEVGYGELRLANVDGALDALATYGFDGRLLRVLAGDDAGIYSSFASVFVGTMLAPRVTEEEVQILVRDRLFELERPLLTATYGGTNVLPAGVDGEDDIKGRVIPRAYGIVRGTAPVIVNTARNIYQISDGALNLINRVYDNAVQFTNGADYVSQADMEANVPAAGTARRWAAGGMFRLGGASVGQVTADADQGANAAARTAAQMMKAMALSAGIPSGDISAADVTALDTANGSECGLWVTDTMTARVAMEIIANSVGAWFGFDRLGVLRMQRLSAPSGTPVATLSRLTPGAVTEADTIDLLDLKLTTGTDADRGIPVHRVTVEYQRCYTVQRDVLDNAGAVLPAQRAFFSQEYRTQQAQDLAVKTTYLLSPEITIRTALHGNTPAANEAARQLTLRKVRRDRLTATIRADQTVATIDLGTLLSVRAPRFGLGAGKLFTVIGIEMRLAANEMVLELWG